MEHVASSDVAWEEAPEQYFSGRVWFGLLAPPIHDAALNTLAVMFSPGARTAWHRHIEGQVLYIAHGNGIVANDAGERVNVAAGDTVVIPPGEVHWHGASPAAHMMHLSLTTGGPTEWLERKVSDKDYGA
jgi:quercetin dioxygenase-like cupin family protein